MMHCAGMQHRELQENIYAELLEHAYPQLDKQKLAAAAAKLNLTHPKLS